MKAKLAGAFVAIVVVASTFARAAEAPLVLAALKRGYGPEQATGAPDTPRAGDLPTAWAAKRPEDGIQWLKVEFAKAVDIAEVRVRESHCPGGVCQVSAFVEGGREITLWAGRDPTRDAPKDMVVKVVGKVVSKSVKIYIDTELARGWEEIDAVELVGKDGTRQWAVRATASTTFARPRAVVPRGPAPPPPPPPEPPAPRRLVPPPPPRVPQEAAAKRGWSPGQATGAPDTPQAGDFPTAWTARAPEAGMQWLQVEYDRAVSIAEVRVRETNIPGGVRRVTAFVDGGREVELWRGRDPTVAAPADLVVKAKDEVVSRVVKLTIDTNAKRGEEQIDAVELVAKNGARQWASRATASSAYTRLPRPPVPPAPVRRLARVPPRVVAVHPPPHAVDVPADLKEIKVTFDRPMAADEPWAWMLLRPCGTFPAVAAGAKPRFDPTGRTCTLPVVLAKDAVYAVGINVDAPRAFTDRAEVPALSFAWAFATGGYRTEELPPRVVRTEPPQGAVDVDPGLKTVTITFDRPMRPGAWSVRPQPDRGEFPLSASRNPRFDERGTTCALPVELKPGTVYAVAVNSASRTGFKGRAGAPALPFALAFKTRK